MLFDCLWLVGFFHNAGLLLPGLGGLSGAQVTLRVNVSISRVLPRAIKTVYASIAWAKGERLYIVQSQR